MIPVAPGSRPPRRAATVGVLLPAVLFAFAACTPGDDTPAASGPPEGASGAELPRIAGVQDSLVARQNRADLDGVVSLFTEDAVLMPPARTRTVVGRDSVRAYYADRFGTETFTRGIEAGTAEVSGSLAFAIGRRGGILVREEGADTVPTADRYLVVLRRDREGVWRIVRMAWQELDG